MVDGSAASDAWFVPGDPNVLAGTFKVTLQSASASVAASVSVLGKVYDGATPAATIWDVKATSGGCQLLVPRVPFCETPCGSSKVCVADNTCVAYPTSHSVGAVRVRGIGTTTGSSDFTMTPISNGYQAPAGVTLAYPPFSPGDKLTFDAAGADYPAFSLAGKGIAVLEVAATSLTAAADTALPVRWTAAATDLAKVHVKLDVSHHGGSKGKIECEAEDTGALDIPADLMTQLLALGVAGYPSIVVSRDATSFVVGPSGRIELVVSSITEKSIDVTGLTSCTKNEDCPAGKTCQSDLTCQ